MEGTINKRIKAICQYLNISGNELSRQLDTAQATTNIYIKGKRPPSYEFVERLLSKYKDISAEWLMRGEGKMLRSDCPSNDVLMREVADLKMKLMVSNGVIKELKDILMEKNNAKKNDGGVEQKTSLVG